MNCPVCGAEVELVLRQTDRDADAVIRDALDTREGWAAVEDAALLREARGDA